MTSPKEPSAASHAAPDIAWQRPAPADAAARLAAASGTGGAAARYAVLRVPTVALDRAWQRTPANAERTADATTTAASISFGRTIAQLHRTNRATAPLVRYAAADSAEILFADGRDVFAAAMALGVPEAEIVVREEEAQRFLDDVGGRRVATLGEPTAG